MFEYILLFIVIAIKCDSSMFLIGIMSNESLEKNFFGSFIQKIAALIFFVGDFVLVWMAFKLSEDELVPILVLMFIVYLFAKGFQYLVNRNSTSKSSD